MIEVTDLTKSYGDHRGGGRPLIHRATGQVTGFLGPNGAGKSTTMRLILGLDAPTSGVGDGERSAYAGYRRPLFEVGAMLEAEGVARRAKRVQPPAVPALSATGSRRPGR